MGSGVQDVTTNWSLGKVSELMDDRIASRLATFTMIELSGSDLRVRRGAQDSSGASEKWHANRVPLAKIFYGPMRLVEKEKRNMTLADKVVNFCDRLDKELLYSAGRRRPDGNGYEGVYVCDFELLHEILETPHAEREGMPEHSMVGADVSARETDLPFWIVEIAKKEGICMLL